ncbi:Hypothetical protein BN2458_PEG0541 [Helicobacter typhlonius]|uniref:Uncharacterized protein n=1 Tax=Helicobacter typhlonius TaxID=76936 RepID=A0A0S4PT06_9HELI|nr:Hypothetical protein BN2458_PEG0541 [Helicobacter typhlonius]
MRVFFPHTTPIYIKNTMITRIFILKILSFCKIYKTQKAVVYHIQNNKK